MLSRKRKAHPRLRGDYIGLLLKICIAPGSSPPARGLPYGVPLPRCELLGSSPPARGLLQLLDLLVLHFRLIPACAGTTKHRPVRNENSQAHPRLRGDYENPTISSCVAGGSSPPARGLRQHYDMFKVQCRLIPACAGTTMPASIIPVPARAHPRLRGDYF